MVEVFCQRPPKLQGESMSDTAERRLECKARHTQLDKLWNWFMGNGNKGAGVRLIALEDLANGKEETATMKELKKHLNWHKESKIFMWATMVPIYIMLSVMFLQIVGVIK